MRKSWVRLLPSGLVVLCVIFFASAGLAQEPGIPADLALLEAGPGG